MYFTIVDSEDESEDGVAKEEEVVAQAAMAGIPPSVQAAFNFVAMSNQFQGLRGFPSLDGVVVREQELHPANEAAYRLACNVLGTWFACEGRRIRWSLT